MKDYLNNTPLNKRIIVDNIFIQNSPDPFLIDTYEKALEIIAFEKEKILGRNHLKTSIVSASAK